MISAKLYQIAFCQLLIEIVFQVGVHMYTLLHICWKKIVFSFFFDFRGTNFLPIPLPIFHNFRYQFFTNSGINSPPNLAPNLLLLLRNNKIFWNDYLPPPSGSTLLSPCAVRPPGSDPRFASASCLCKLPTPPIAAIVAVSQHGHC